MFLKVYTVMSIKRKGDGGDDEERREIYYIYD
jgi:hypothetical protein